MKDIELRKKSGERERFEVICQDSLGLASDILISNLELFNSRKNCEKTEEGGCSYRVGASQTFWASSSGILQACGKPAIGNY